MGLVCRNERWYRVGDSHPSAIERSDTVALARSMHEQGHGYKHIGQMLSVSPHTVRDWCTYRTSYAS